MPRKKKVSTEKPWLDESKEKAPKKAEPVREKVRRYFGSGRVWGGKNIACEFDPVTKSLDTSDKDLWSKLDQIGFKYESDPVDEIKAPPPADPLYQPALVVNKVKN